MALLYASRARFLHHSESFHRGEPVDFNGGIKTALDRYRVDLGTYPTNFNDLVQQPAGTTNWGGPYLEQFPSNYIYEFPGKHNPNSYDLMSAGPDGKKGTEDDIGNW